MTTPVENIFGAIPASLPQELVETLASGENLRIERIVSRGHKSPPDFWYQQDEHEWVVVLQGAGEILWEDGRRRRLQTGDCQLIPAGERHRVSWTEPQADTLWLAVFWREAE